MARDREPYIKYRVLGAFIVPRMTTAGNRNQSRGLWAQRCLSRLLFSYVISLSWVIPFPTPQGWYKYTGRLPSKVGDRNGCMSRKERGRASKGQTGRAIFSLASLCTLQVRSPHTPQDAGKTPIVWRVAVVVRRSDMKAQKRAFGVDKGQATHLNLSDINLSLKMG